VHDTVRIDTETGKILEHFKFEVGNVAMITGGRNLGRVGTITSRERHEGSFDIVHITDAAGHPFATRISNVFVLGKGNKPAISLPARKGVKLSILEERELRLKKASSSA
jgi:small subunit ribosomal protein S4e